MLVQNSQKDSPNQSLTERQRRIYRYLNSHSVAVLSTVTPNGDPHGVAVYYSISRSFEISILTKRGTRKYDNMIHNNHVMLTVADPQTQTTAQISGVAAEYQDEAQIAELANQMFGRKRTNRQGVPPIMKLEVGDFAAFRIEPKQIRMAVYNRPDPGDYESLFDCIESFDLRS